ncbi:MAG: hypothetical protein J5643_07260 [Lachnospiraceae bacterium]|nr:hypothetical protein [Lachnospiraceae bacterium]
MKHWRIVYLAIPLTLAVFELMLCANSAKGPELCEGVRRVPAVVRYAAEAEAETEETAEYRMESYTEGESPIPVWWDPDEPMAAEWVDNARQSDYNAIQRTDMGCPDWNADSTLYGWDGHSMEAWEMDVFSRIFYLEYWGSSDILCEAGCDAILRMWEMDGGTMYETLSHINENGSYAYSTFPGMWDETYDSNGLAWCRAYCEARFISGPTWIAPYFQKYGWPDWGEWTPVPAYEIDGIFFSVPRG